MSRIFCFTGGAFRRYSSVVDIGITDRFVSGNIVVVEISGEVDVYTAARLHQHLVGLINSGYVLLVLDIQNAEFFDSTGLSVPVGALKRVRPKGGTVVFAGPPKRLEKILRSNGLTRIFHFFENVDQAIQEIYSGLLSQFPKQSLLGNAPEISWHWFPGRIYTSDENAGEAVEEGLNAVLDAFGMDAVFSFPPQRGSWFRESLLRMKDSTARPTRDEFLDLLQRAIEQQAFDKPQAQIDITQSQAVAILLAALEKTPKGIVQVGSLLVIKVMETVYVRNLTQRELLYWEKHPGLFRDPERALQELQHAGDEDDQGPGHEKVSLALPV